MIGIQIVRFKMGNVDCIMVVIYLDSLFGEWEWYELYQEIQYFDDYYECIVIDVIGLLEMCEF